jgi:hypothetical protein
VVSLVPNRAALLLAMRAVGFDDVHALAPEPDQDPQYVLGDRAVAIGRVPA